MFSSWFMFLSLSFHSVSSGLRFQPAQTPKRGYVAIEILSDTVEAAKKPSVVAIDGLALGGGLEIAMEPSNSEDVFPVAGARKRFWIQQPHWSSVLLLGWLIKLRSQK